MPLATGVAKQLRYKKEVTWGVAPGASGAQLLRRVTSDLDLSKETYESSEIRSDYQVSDYRHGIRRVQGSINGELSPGTYKDFMAAAMRQAFQTAPTSGALINVTASATAPHYVRASGSWITNGFKVGDVVRWSGWLVATTNNARNFLITALTATDMSGIHLDGTAVVARASGDSVTVTLQGKKTWTPQTGHTDESFAIEHWFADVSRSELYLGCKVDAIDLELPPTGISKINLGFMGANVTDAATAYYTSPTVETTSGVLAAVNGYLYVQGTQIAICTGLKVSYKGGMSSDPVVGASTVPDIFEGRVMVEGEMSAYFENNTFRDLFINETEATLFCTFTTANIATADFISLVLPRIKYNGSKKSDGEKAIIQTMPFKALLNGAGGSSVNSEKATLTIQDSTVA